VIRGSHVRPGRFFDFGILLGLMILRRAWRARA
jgi:hypothetical protein